MNKILISLILILCISVGCITTTATYNAPEVLAEAAVLMDTSTGQVVFSKNMDKKMYPASITKIMTVILALENLDMDATLTVKEEDVDTVPKDTAHIALDYGEEIKVSDLVYSAMLASANDAANVLARGVSGSVGEFAKLMNQKAAELGAVNTHFANANGLHDKNHYTTAYDMALISKYAISNETFKKILTTDMYEVAPTNKQEEARLYANPHKMIKNTPYIYEGAIGGKNGWTTEAGYTLVTYANRDNTEFVAVVLDSGYQLNDKFDDTTTLFDYGYNEFSRTVIPAEKLQNQFAGTKISKEIDVKTLYDAEFLEHSSEKGQFVTHIAKESTDEYTLTVKSQSGVTLYTRKYTTASSKLGSFASIIKKIFGIIFKIILAVLSLFIMFVILAIIRTKIRRERRRKNRLKNTNYR